jgi:hypothetical protein
VVVHGCGQVFRKGLASLPRCRFLYLAYYFYMFVCGGLFFENVCMVICFVSPFCVCDGNMECRGLGVVLLTSFLH